MYIKQVTSPRFVSTVILLFLIGFIACILLGNYIYKIEDPLANDDFRALSFILHGLGFFGVLWSLFVFFLSFTTPGGKMHLPPAELDLGTATHIFNRFFQQYFDLCPAQNLAIREIINESRQWGYLLCIQDNEPS